MSEVDQLLTVKDLERKLKVSKRTIWNMLRQGRIPGPVRVGSRSTRWLASDISEWLECGCQVSGQ